MAPTSLPFCSLAIHTPTSKDSDPSTFEVMAGLPDIPFSTGWSIQKQYLKDGESSSGHVITFPPQSLRRGFVINKIFLQISMYTYRITLPGLLVIDYCISKKIEVRICTDFSIRVIIPQHLYLQGILFCNVQNLWIKQNERCICK
jgi:hypothetical protein